MGNQVKITIFAKNTAMATRKEERIYAILRDYQGDNPQIRYYKSLYLKGKFYIDDFSASYILGNWDFQPIEVGKIVLITEDLSHKLQEKYSLDFFPKKLYITRIVGEMGASWHCYMQYRQSIPPRLAYLPKKDIVTQVYVPDYTKLLVDFKKFDDMTGDEGRKLRQHQKDGARFLLANRKSILADGMGTGKTTTCVITALAGGFRKVLIVCPASLKTNWEREISIYDKEKNDIGIVSGTEWTPGDRFTIVNYDILDNFYKVPEEPEFRKRTVIDPETGEEKEIIEPVLVRDKSTKEMRQKMRRARKKDVIAKAMAESPMYQECFDCVFIDEAQNLSNTGSIRYKVMDDFLRRSGIKNIYLVTGTPLTNRPMNLFNLLRLIQHPLTRDYEYFAMRFCGGKKKRIRGKDIIMANGTSNLGELMERLKNVYIRRTADDMKGMVKKYVYTVRYSLTDLQKAEYDGLWEQYMDLMKSVDTENHNENYQELIEGSLYRQYLAENMVPHTEALVDKLLGKNEKVVIITTYQKEMDLLKGYYKENCVVYNGKMTIRQKDKAQKAFMEDPAIKVFIGQIKACGVGITLTVSSNLVFNSFDWVAANNRQAEDRVYRITSMKDATIYYQMFKDTYAEEMFDKVLVKQMITDTIIKKENDKFGN